jgi:predicted metal-dependent peptidase
VKKRLFAIDCSGSITAVMRREAISHVAIGDTVVSFGTQVYLDSAKIINSEEDKQNYLFPNGGGTLYFPIVAYAISNSFTHVVIVTDGFCANNFCTGVDKDVEELLRDHNIKTEFFTFTGNINNF